MSMRPFLSMKESVSACWSRGKEWTGVAAGITETGELIVKKDSGEICEISSGEVSVRGVYGYV